MKKFIIYLTVLCTFFLPSAVFAERVDHDCSLEDVYISYMIDMLGSVHVKEAFVFKGSLNGNRRNLYFKNTSLSAWSPGAVDLEESSFYNARGMSLKTVSTRKIEKDDIGWNLLNIPYENFEEKTYASEGDDGVYTKEVLSNGYEIKTYDTNEDGYKVYYYEYYINQAVVLHNDVAEFYYDVFKTDTDNAKNVHIQVLTPGETTSDDFRFWAHGPLSGELRGISDKKDEDGRYIYKGVLLEVPKYKMGSTITVRMLFDKSQVSLLNSVLNESGMDAKDKIIEIETKYAEEANRQREKAIFINNALQGLGFAYIAGLIGLWIFIYLKYDKEHKVQFDHDYYREFEGPYNVEVVDYLMKKDITQDAFNASIMNMIYKKNVDFSEAEGDKKNLVLALKTRGGLNDTENKLLDLLFNDIGKDNKVSLKEIEKFSSKYDTAQIFMKGYDSWKLSATKDGMMENFFEEHTGVRALSSLYFILGVAIFIAMISFGITNILLYVGVLLGAILFLIYVLTFKKWSEKGREHYLKWKAFKRFLLDFGNLHDKEIPEVKLWDKYLVYATVLGVAKEVQKSMKVKLSEIGSEDDVLVTRSFTYSDYYFMNSLTRSLSMAHTNSQSVINAELAKSSMSSGGGFGGGFSGGGHGGGGSGGGSF